MPIGVAYERDLTPAGRQTMTGAIEQMRQVGSSVLQQEHLIMRLATEFSPVFKTFGADLDFFKRIFDVDPGAAPFQEDFKVSGEVHELITAAIISPDGRRVRAGPLNLLEATHQHSQGRLRNYLMHAQFLSGNQTNEDLPDRFWDVVTAHTRRSRFSKVA